MTRSQPPHDGVHIGGSVSNSVVQNAHGDHNTATNHAIPTSPEQQAVIDSLAAVRAALDSANLSPEDRAECDQAVETLQKDRADPKNRRLSIRHALGILTQAATTVAGLSLAVNNLQHAIQRIL